MSLQYFKYRFPFVIPLQTSQKTFEYREGILLEYSDKDFACYGEIAPLPGYSSETVKEVIKKIKKVKDDIKAKLDANNPVDLLQDFYKEEELPASLQFGLDSVAYQIQANREDKTLQSFLFSDVMDQIPVNALQSLQTDEFLAETRKQIAKGYRTIKFKIGLDFATELERLQKIRSEFSDLTIRLDANQSWSTETALRHFQKLESLDVEYCEEPLKNATPENFELLSQHTPIPLALDESISRHSYWPNLLPFTSYLIIKPMVLGNFSKNFETKRLADTHNNKAVFTTSLESGVGRQMTAVLASGLGSPQTAHGISTGNLLIKDVDSSLSYISEGYYHVNRSSQSRIVFEKADAISSISF